MLKRLLVGRPFRSDRLQHTLLPKRIAYTTDALSILELLASLDNPLARRVSADLDHFSTYAVAW